MTASNDSSSSANTSTNPASGYWFKRRRFGIGWIPSTPQGWISLAAFIGALSLSNVVMSDGMRKGPAGKIWTLGLTSAFLALVWSRGPRPKLRWGKSANDNPLEDA